MPSSYSAVLFDLGGVVLGSPLEAIRAFETEHDLPDGFISRVVVENGSSGAWARHETGEIGFETFCAEFEEECEAAGETVPVADLMQAIHRVTKPRPQMLRAIGRLRSEGLAVGAITNNWAGPGGADLGSGLRSQFDLIIESSVEGIRKPDPRIYLLACERLRLHPTDVVFLDDIGANLKPARTLGMKTIRVDDPIQALRELGTAVGVILV